MEDLGNLSPYICKIWAIKSFARIELGSWPLLSCVGTLHWRFPFSFFYPMQNFFSKLKVCNLYPSQITFDICVSFTTECLYNVCVGVMTFVQPFDVNLFNLHL